MTTLMTASNMTHIEERARQRRPRRCSAAIVAVTHLARRIPRKYAARIPIRDMMLRRTLGAQAEPAHQKLDNQVGAR
jgi:hypothetical protein